MTPVQEAIQTAGRFLSASVATETGLPLVQRLHGAIPSLWTPRHLVDTEQAQVILYSLDLLNTIHVARGAQLGIKGWRQVNALVEIIIVLGLYKCLSIGVGIPESKRTKSILLEREGLRGLFPDGERRIVLESIVSQFRTIMEQGGEVGESMQRKHRTDLVSGLAELSFNPSFSPEDRTSWKTQYESFLSQ